MGNKNGPGDVRHGLSRMRRQWPSGQVLGLTREETVVLFELLRRWSADGTVEHLPFEHPGEKVGLAILGSALELEVLQSLDIDAPDYSRIVDTARRALAAGQR